MPGSGQNKKNWSGVTRSIFAQIVVKTKRSGHPGLVQKAATDCTGRISPCTRRSAVHPLQNDKKVRVLVENKECFYRNIGFFYRNNEFFYRNNEFFYRNLEFFYKNIGFFYRNNGFFYKNIEFFYRNIEFFYRNNEYFYKNIEFFYRKNDYFCEPAATNLVCVHRGDHCYASSRPISQ